MANTARTRGVFNTHKGKIVQRVLWVAAILSFCLMILNGILNNDPGAPDQQQAAGSQNEASAKKADPEVKVAPSDPFRRRVAEKVVAAPEDGSGESSLFQNAVVVAGEGAKKFSTYSHQQSAEAYVNLIPNLTPEAAKAVSESAKANWPSIESEQVTAVGVIRSIQPKVVSFDAEAGTASVSVTIAQNVKDRDGNYEFSRSYRVDLRKANRPGNWEITSIT